MATKLTKKERGFAKTYIDTGNGTQAVMEHYDVTSENSAASIASQNLRKLKIREYIESKAQDASSMVYELSQYGEAEAIRLNASKDILDRAGFKPIEKSQNINVNVEVESNPIVEELANKLDEIYKGTDSTSDGVEASVVDIEA
jgi:phage terminase small subunit